MTYNIYLKNEFSDKINTNVYKQIINRSIEDAKSVNNYTYLLLSIIAMILLILAFVFAIILKVIHTKKN
jgi:hypothetical protein